MRIPSATCHESDSVIWRPIYLRFYYQTLVRPNELYSANLLHGRILPSNLGLMPNASARKLIDPACEAETWGPCCVLFTLHVHIQCCANLLWPTVAINKLAVACSVYEATRQPGNWILNQPAYVCLEVHRDSTLSPSSRKSHARIQPHNF